MDSQGEEQSRWPLSVLGAPGWLALGWVLGTALQLQQDQLWSLPAYGLPVVAALLFAGWRYPSWPGGVLMALAGALAFGAAGWRSLERSADRLDPALWGQEVQLVGVVASLPVRGPQGMRLVLAVESAQMRGEPVRVPRRVALSLWQPAHGAASLDPERLPAVTAGDRWQMSVRLTTAEVAGPPMPCRACCACRQPMAPRRCSPAMWMPRARPAWPCQNRSRGSIC